MILGQGIDIIEVKRIERAIERWGDAFKKHVFTEQELEHAKKFTYPMPHLAGRFAAKEAIFKAVGDPHLTWQDVSIMNDTQGKPECHWQKPISSKVILSISHCKEYAVAHAIMVAS